MTGPVPLLKQELQILQGASPVFSRFMLFNMIFSLGFCRSLFVLFCVAIVLSVLLFKSSDYHYGIFKLFLRTFKLLTSDRKSNTTDIKRRNYSRLKCCDFVIYGQATTGMYGETLCEDDKIAFYCHYNSPIYKMGIFNEHGA